MNHSHPKLKALLCLWIFAAVSLPTQAADTPPAKALTAEEQKVLDFHVKKQDALLKRDYQTFESTLAENMYYLRGNLFIMTRKEYMEITKNDTGFYPVAYTLDELAVRGFGDTYVITGVLTLYRSSTGELGGPEFPKASRRITPFGVTGSIFTAVYRKKGDSFELISQHNSAVGVPLERNWNNVSELKGPLPGIDARTGRTPGR